MNETTMTSHDVGWRKRAFEIVAAGCVAFVILTALAMVFYPGGTHSNKSAQGYSFFVNFFSDLGRTQALNGTPNPIAATLFALALGGAGLVLALFFSAFAAFFWGGLWQRVLCGYGSAFGIIAGFCFLGVACTPANLYGGLHRTFVEWAFRTFLLAALIYSGLIFSKRDYPRLGAWIFTFFAVGLASYVALLTWGPSTKTSTGLLIQVTGQKLIAYASVLSVGGQAGLARLYGEQISAVKNSISNS